MVPVPCPPAPLFDCAVCWVACAGPLRFWEVAWCGCPAAPRKPEDRKGGRRVVVRSSRRPSQWRCLHNSCHGASFERHKPFNSAFPFPKGCLLCLWRAEFLCLRSEHPLFFFFLRQTTSSFVDLFCCCYFPSIFMSRTITFCEVGPSFKLDVCNW